MRSINFEQKIGKAIWKFFLGGALHVMAVLINCECFDFLDRLVNCEVLLKKLAMLKFIESPELVIKMGKRSRQIAEEKYDVDKVNAVMLSEMGLS